LPEAFFPPETAGKSISITEGLARVLRDSRLIKVSLPDKDMAFEDTLIARSALFPHLSASVSKTFYRYQPGATFGGSTVFTDNKNPFTFGVDLYQTLFDFGKSLSVYEASQEALNAKKANVESVKRMAMLEFIAAYFDLLEAEKMIAVAAKEVESITAYMGDVQHLYEQGVVTKNDLLPAQVRLADAQQRLIAARNGRELAEANLNNILALPLKEKTGARDIEMNPPELPAIEEGWRTAEAQRPEIAFLDRLEKASAFSEQAKARENAPTVFAQAGYSYTQNNYIPHHDNVGVTLGAKMNLYEGGSDRAEQAKERARGRQLKEQRGKLVEDIRFEVENSYVGLKNAGEKVQVARDALGQADENVRVNRVKYAEGVATSTEVLEAITLQTGAQTNYYNADYELKRVYARLMYSLGIDLVLVYERMERGQNERTK
jgi:outer membrane protein TolC